ncbi:hypothetical protein IV203_023946 [Nitzschia inconspicua]|uniref:Uncharacterized protein n=1 Tax=Nitzschia inconspicua TaxID=303405 RepID=A0A9K3KBD1_9STRA|nr:hypothetical protein IV203_023946 [Nitzschia inconspicua]
MMLFCQQVESLSLPQSTTNPKRSEFSTKQQSSDTTISSVPSYLQWKSNDDNSNWEMQTKITTFQRGPQTIELHAQLHYGDDVYYQYWNHPKFNTKFDKILFELLVDEALLETNSDGSRRVKEPIMASSNDQSLAVQYGWHCQASSINYQHPKWIHADLSRQEFIAMAKHDNNNKSNTNIDSPIWKFASPESSSAAAEAVAAFMVGPPTLSYSTKFLKRRLFTNLFLPGGTLASALRTILWWTVPSPELSIVLLDWASLLPGGTNPNALSKVALPILTSFLQFDIPQMRRFLFGQVLISSKQSNSSPSESSSSSSTWSLLVTERNDHALQVLEQTLEQPNTNSVALLYGSSHCPDLHQKLVQSGFSPTVSTWRTAWSVHGAKIHNSNNNNSSSSSSSDIAGHEYNSIINKSTATLTALPALIALLAFYLVIGALDWVGVLGDVSLALEKSNFVDAGVESTLYLARHVLLYLGLSKFLVDWTNTTEDSTTPM